MRGLSGKIILKTIEKGYDKYRSFVWICNRENTPYNVNADDIVSALILYIEWAVSNILYLTKSWWLQDIESKIIPFMTKNRLKKILVWKDEKVKTDGQMKKKLSSWNNAILNGASKFTIAHIKNIKEEIESLSWTGTMIGDLEKAVFRPLKNRKMFDFIYTEIVKQGDWRERSEQEKNIIYENYKVLELDGTILWWFALRDFEFNWKKWKILECIFSIKERCGIGSILWDAIKDNVCVYTYSKKREYFMKLWFTEVKWKSSPSWSPLYVYEKREI